MYRMQELDSGHVTTMHRNLTMTTKSYGHGISFPMFDTFASTTLRRHYPPAVPAGRNVSKLRLYCFHGCIFYGITGQRHATLR